MDTKKNNYGFLRVAAISPEIRIGNPEFNTVEIRKWLTTFEKQDIAIAVFPEMCITGYTAGDLFFSRTLQEAALDGLRSIRKASGKNNTVLIVGLPLSMEGKLFNVAAVLHNGVILGLVPKTYIPNYKEFYEKRWFSSARELTQYYIEIDGRKISVGTDLLFSLQSIPGAVLGVEICEDLWMPIPPSSIQTLYGATIIANLSASNDIVGKADYRRKLVEQQSARGICGYVYASCGSGESSTDLVFGGHLLIAENGVIMEERKPVKSYCGAQYASSEIDIAHLLHDREKTTDFAEGIHALSGAKEFRRYGVKNSMHTIAQLRNIDRSPFVPGDGDERRQRAEEIFSIQVQGLVSRMQATGIKDLVIGLSGGLDSTLAFLVAVEAASIMEGKVHALTMPARATNARTRKNAELLAKELGLIKEITITFAEIDIKSAVWNILNDLKHDMEKEDKIFENTQARYRTLLLLNRANELNGLVIGTSDLSEIALGWCTFNGDHIAHYNVNCGVPKTLVKYIVEWYCDKRALAKLEKILEDILNTDYSPELVGDGNTLTQKTEELMGPYELHDFFLYHFIRWGSSPEKIFFLAKQAWEEKYSAEEIKKMLRVFVTRFFGNQWKRSVATDGPKVGSVSLSPRGDWRMPSDMDAALWISAIEKIETA